MYSGKPKAIRWYDDGVQLTSPSLIQCQEVVSLLTYKHTDIKIIKSSPDVVCDLLPVLLQNEKVKSLENKRHSTNTGLHLILM